MAPFAFSGKADRVLRSWPWIVFLMVALCTSALVWHAETQRHMRTAPLQEQFEALQKEVSTLQDQARHQPPPRPVHQHLARLRQLAYRLPGLEPLHVVRADADDTGELNLGAFDGDILRVTIRGSMISVTALCRQAQAILPIWIESLSSTQGRGDVAMLVFGTG